MALTMTRTRTQTALTHLAILVACVHGELELLERLMADDRAQGLDVAAAMGRRHRVLLEQRDALYVTVRQFNPELDPTSIGSMPDWQKPFGRPGTKPALARYRRWLAERP